MFVSGDYRTHMYDPGQGFPPHTFHFSVSSTIEAGDSVHAVVVSMDGRMIASGSRSGNILNWDTKSHNLNIGKLLRGQFALYVSRRIHYGLSLEVGIGVFVCGIVKHDKQWVLRFYVWSVCTDERLIVSGSLDKTIRNWNFTGEHLGKPINAGHFIYAVVLSNNGRIVARVGEQISVWDAPYFLDERPHIGCVHGRSFIRQSPYCFGKCGSEYSTVGRTDLYADWGIQWAHRLCVVAFFFS